VSITKMQKATPRDANAAKAGACTSDEEQPPLARRDGADDYAAPLAAEHAAPVDAMTVWEKESEQECGGCEEEDEVKSAHFVPELPV
jgi:hypothetical protein